MICICIWAENQCKMYQIAYVSESFEVHVGCKMISSLHQPVRFLWISNGMLAQTGSDCDMFATLFNRVGIRTDCRLHKHLNALNDFQTYSSPTQQQFAYICPWLNILCICISAQINSKLHPLDYVLAHARIKFESN